MVGARMIANPPKHVILSFCRRVSGGGNVGVGGEVEGYIVLYARLETHSKYHPRPK